MTTSTKTLIMTYDTESHISTIADVKAFAEYLNKERKEAFHPDDDFADYVCFDGENKGKPSFTPSEVDLFKRLMDECFDICKKQQADIYEAMFIPII